MNRELSPNSKLQHKPKPAWWNSDRTSEIKGALASPHTLERCSNKEAAKARAAASNLKNDRVSSDHRPPTSPASTTSLARLRGPTNSGWVLSLRRRATTMCAAPGFGRPVTMVCRHRCGVHRKLCPTVQRQTLGHLLAS